MLIYFDESYDQGHRYLLLGTLYVPASRRLNKRLREIKDKHRATAPHHTFKELKYSRSNDRFTSAACRDAVDAFAKSSAFFRAVAIDTALPGFSWDYFGTPSTPSALKRAYAYNKFAELLLRFNLRNIHDAVLLADSLTRTSGDNFVQYIASTFGPSISPDWTVQPAQLRHVQEVDTRLEAYQVGQICDILLGAILGDLVPPRSHNKLALIQHVKSVLGTPSFGADFWRAYPKYIVDTKFPKFQVWHWRP
jgi:hypothetical protein